MGPKKQSTSDVNTTIKGGAKSAKSAKSNKVSFDISSKGLNTIQIYVPLLSLLLIYIFFQTLLKII